jgi:hypothetical protein
VIWQWVWKLRLALGQRGATGSVRSLEWAPALSVAAVERPVATNEPSEAYGPLEWAQLRGRAKGGFSAEAFPLRAAGMLQCPAGKLLWLTETRQASPTTQRLTYVARDHDGTSCPLHASCLSQSASGQRGRRVSARRRRRASPITTVGGTQGDRAMRWQDVAGRGLRRNWTAYWRSQAVTIGRHPPRALLPTRPPRAARAHRRLDWDERLGRNACAPQRLATIHVAGVSPTLLDMLGARGESATP